MQIQLKKKIDNIISTKVSDKDKINMLLELNANQCRTGTMTKKTSRYIYRHIKSLDYNLGSLLLS